ncbi:MAG: hypothetical protein KC455_01855 [Carnobacterium sp.]|nr:hypothetical protein [Carnobacterium sp.]
MKDIEIIMPKIDKFMKENGDKFKNKDDAIQAFIKQYNQELNDPSFF